MNNDKLIINTIFPKSNNHKITWNRKDKITTCDINKNCVEIIFDIKKNKKIINDEMKKNNYLFNNYKSIEKFKQSKSNYFNYLLNIIQLSLFMIILLIIYFSI